MISLGLSSISRILVGHRHIEPIAIRRIEGRYQLNQRGCLQSLHLTNKPLETLQCISVMHFDYLITKMKASEQ